MKLSRSRAATLLVLGIAALLVFAAALPAQSVGRITGTVFDPSGLAIPGAEVTIENTGTGLTYKATANEAGLFGFPELPIGTYRLTVTSEGFKKLVRPNIQLLTAQSLDLPVTLEIGEVSESVEVAATAPLLESTVSTVQTTVDVRQMEELPLNGRNPLQLVMLTPGAIASNVDTTTGQQDNEGVAVNGARASDNTYRLDGGNYTNTWFNSAPVLPNPDTLQEFTVQSSNYNAKNSGAGVVVEMSTRSGTNKFHGSLFEFMRNEKLNAADTVSRTRAPFKRHQYGGTLGGPIRRDKTFFFGSYQGTRERATPSMKVTTPPSAAMRQGDFSGITQIIVDPNTGQPFPGNIIPSDRLDPITLKLVNTIVPLPNSGNRLIVPRDADKDDDQFLAKVDHVFSTRNQMSVRFFYDHYNFQRDTNSVPGVFGDNVFRNRSFTIRDTHTFSPNFVLTASATYSRFFRDQIPQTPTTLRDAGVQYPLGREEDLKEGIRFAVAGYFNLFSGGALQQIPAVQGYRGSAYYTRGRHVMQFGVDFDHHNVYHVDVSQFEGQFRFNGARTRSSKIKGSGRSMADALLGLPQWFKQNAGKSNRLIENQVHFWFQDDWKAWRGLTLNLGVRWEPWLPAVDKDGSDRDRLTGFIPGYRSQMAPQAPVGMVFPNDPGFPTSLIRKDWNNLAPRVGFAWDVFQSGKTVLRGGYGIYYKRIAGQVIAKATEIQPFSLLVYRQDLVSSIADPYIGYPGGSPFPFRPPTSLDGVEFKLPVTGQIFDPTISTGYLQNWNFTVEQAIPGDMVVSAGYLGNHAVKLLGTVLANPGLYGPGATKKNLEQRRIYPDYGQLNTRGDFGYSNYHALQIQVRRRAASGLTLLANYSFAKAMDNVARANNNNSGVRNPFDLNSDRGLSDNDVKHIANFAFVYSLPTFRFDNPFLGGLINGWQTNGIVTVRSGLPVTPLSGADNSLSGNNLDHPDLIGDPARPVGVDKQVQWFNVDAFVPNAPGTFGTAGRNIIRAAGSSSVDLSLFKNFRLKESLKLQVRGEAFNALNHPNLGKPNVTITNVNFGRVLEGGNPRVIQLALKLLF